MARASHPKSTEAQRRARRWPRRLALSGIVSVSLLTGFFLALTCRPHWYAPAEIDRSRLREDKQTHLAIENTISAQLNRGETVTIELTDQQVNRWIAAREELWPGEVPSLEPLQGPQASFMPGGRIRLAGTVQQNMLSVVASIVFELSIEQGDLRVAWASLHAGALPAPNALVKRLAASLNDTGALRAEDIAAGSVLIPNDFTWPNGKRRCRVQSIETEAGLLRVTLAPY